MCLFLCINVALGLFGVLSYSISRRKAEVGFRRALGGHPGSIIGQFTMEGCFSCLLSVDSRYFLRYSNTDSAGYRCSHRYFLSRHHIRHIGDNGSYYSVRLVSQHSSIKDSSSYCITRRLKSLVWNKENINN